VGVTNANYPCFQCQRSLKSTSKIFVFAQSLNYTRKYGVEINFISLEAQTLAKKRFSFKAFFTAPQSLFSNNNIHSKYLFVMTSGVMRLDGARRKKQVWRPMFEFEVFRKQMY